MNLVADESVDQPIVARLRSDGHLVEAISELSPGITDEEVLYHAAERGAVLLTADKDFGELVYRQGQVSTGVVLLRLSGLSAENKAVVVSRVIQDHGSELSGAFSVAECDRFRIRRPTA